MVPEFETVTALNNFFSFVFLKVMYTLIKFNIFTWLVERLCLFYGNRPPIQMQQTNENTHTQTQKMHQFVSNHHYRLHNMLMSFTFLLIGS